MTRHLFFSMVLLVAMSIWTGCRAQPTVIAPTDEAIAEQVQLEEGREVQETTSTNTPPPLPPAEESTPGSELVEVTSPVGSEAAVRLAIEDLGQKLNLAADAIRLVSVEAMEWSDTSLGCPQPGMMYAGVITPGFLVVLEAQGTKYNYHTDVDRFVVLCEEGAQGVEDLDGNTEVAASQSSGLPIFVEMTDTILLPGSTPQQFLTETGHNEVFAFDPASQSLLVRSSITIDSATTVVMGVTTVIQSSNRADIGGELFQFPSAVAAPLAVIDVKADTGALVLAYSGQTFDLSPGQSRSFKQLKPGETGVTEVTIITHHGWLTSVSVFPADQGVR